MRSFIAIDIRNEKVEEILEELRGIETGVKVVRPENLHITLKFLGEVAEGRINDIYSAMEDSFNPFEPFEVLLQGVGVFPSLKYMRVIWAGFKENGERIIEMQHKLDEGLARLNFKTEKRFDPHLTLARVKSPRGKEELQDFVQRHKNTELGTFTVEKVELKKSVLTPKGPMYSTVREYELKKSR